MPQFSLLNATRAIERTMPFVLYRLMVYLGVALAYLFAALGGAGTFIAFASFTKNPASMAGFGALLGMGALAYLIHKFRGGLFFSVAGGQLALLGEEAKGIKLPEGKAQVDFAKQRAAATLTPASFQEIELAVTEAARQWAKVSPSSLCPSSNPSLQPALDWLGGAIAASATRALLALHFRVPGGSPWKGAEMGLVQLTRHFDVLFRFALYGLAFEYAGMIAAYIALLYPAEWIASSLPVDVGIWRYVFALIFAWSLKAAFFTPIATTALAHTYLALPEPSASDFASATNELEHRAPAFKDIRARSGD